MKKKSTLSAEQVRERILSMPLDEQRRLLQLLFSQHRLHLHSLGWDVVPREFMDQLMASFRQAEGIMDYMGEKHYYVAERLKRSLKRNPERWEERNAEVKRLAATGELTPGQIAIKIRLKPEWARTERGTPFTANNVNSILRNAKRSRELTN